MINIDETVVETENMLEEEEVKTLMSGAEDKRQISETELNSSVGDTSS